MKNVVLWGAGKICRTYIEQNELQNVEDVKIVDSNDELWGKTLEGIKILNPTAIEWDFVELVILTLGVKFRNEVRNNLLNLHGVSEDKIYTAEEVYCLSAKEQYNAGEKMFVPRVEGGERDFFTGREIGKMLHGKCTSDLECFFYYDEHSIMTKWMHYFDAYDRFFSKYVGKDVTILEIGVWGGGSLQMWKRYFKRESNRVKIYGIDINPECKAYEEDGVEIFIGSQEDREFLRKVKQEIGKVDILIDDGGHTMNQQIVTFEELFDLVADDGVYLCEDLHTSYWKSYGGGYKSDSFIEYSKNLIDYIHANYAETDELVRNKYTERIKYITYCDSMIFIEKRKPTTESLSVICK